MTPDANEEAIIAYIREWQDTYTREAITQQLRDAEYDSAAIDAAWTRIGEEAASASQAPVAPKGPAARPAAPPLSTGRAIAAFVIIWVAIVAVLTILQFL